MRKNRAYRITLLSIGCITASIVWVYYLAFPRFEELAIADPLFYLPAIDITALSYELRMLEETEKSILVNSKQHPEYNTRVNSPDLEILLEEGFLPLSYLHLLPETTTRYETFATHPTFLNAITLLLSYWRATSAYQHESQTLHTVIETSIQTRPRPFGVHNIGTEVSAEVIESDVRLIRQNGAALRKEIQKRTFCLLTGFKCTSQEYNNLIHANIELFEYRSPQPIPETALQEVTLSKDYVGPYVIASTCFLNPVETFYLYINSPYGFLPKLINENYYLDLGKLEEVSQEYVKDTYARKGTRHSPQPEGANYRCTDLRYWGDIATVAYFDERFPERNITSMHDVANLFETEHNLDVDLLKIAENRLPYLPFMIHSINAFLESYRRDAVYFPIDPLYIAGIRSSYALTYQTFSRSVWRLNSSPQYVSGANLPIPHNFRTYSELYSSRVDSDVDNNEPASL